MNNLKFSIKGLCLAFALFGSIINMSAQDEGVMLINEPVAPTLSPGINIRYVDFDKVSMGFTMAVEYRQWVDNKTDSINGVLEKKAKEIKDFEAKCQKKMQNNQYKSESAYKADMQKGQKMVTEYQNLEEKLTKEYQAENATRSKALQETILTFIDEYNAIHKYDAILYKSAGLVFNPALDITDDIIIGLNQRYGQPKEVVIPEPEGLEPVQAPDNTIVP